MEDLLAPEPGLEAPIEVLERHLCIVHRDGDFLYVRTPDNTVFEGRGFTPSEGSVWRALSDAAEHIGLSAEDIGPLHGRQSGT